MNNISLIYNLSNWIPAFIVVILSFVMSWMLSSNVIMQVRKSATRKLDPTFFVAALALFTAEKTQFFSFEFFYVYCAALFVFYKDSDIPGKNLFKWELNLQAILSLIVAIISTVFSYMGATEILPEETASSYIAFAMFALIGVSLMAAIIPLKRPE